MTGDPPRLSEIERALSRAVTLVQSGDDRAAEEILAELTIAADAPLQTLLLRGQVLQRLGRLDEAAREFTRASERFPTSAKAWAARSNACFAMGEHDEALGAIERAVELAPDQAGYILLKARVLTTAGEPDRAEALLRRLTGEVLDRGETSRLLFQVHLKQGRGDDAVAVLKEACARSPNDVSQRVQFAEDLLAADRPQDAFDMIEAAQALRPDDATRFRLAVAAGRICDALGREEQAIEHFSRAAILRPDDPVVLQRLTFHDQEQGHWPQNRPLMLQLQKVRRPTLPPSLAEGLDDLWRRVRSVRSATPAMVWAWEHADQDAWDWDQWRSAAVWGGRASALLKDWWRWAPDRTDEIRALIDPPDLTPVLDALADGRGCILAGAHVGAAAICVEVFRGSGACFTRVGFAGNERALEDERERVVTVTANRLATTRAILDRLRAGDAIGWTLDSPVGAGASVEFMGRRVQLVAIAPRFARRHASASFWCQPLWRGDRIIVEIERLPDPIDGEPEPEWTARWYGAYLQRLEAVVRGDPRNLVLKRGVWYRPRPSDLYGARRRLMERAVSRPSSWLPRD